MNSLKQYKAIDINSTKDTPLFKDDEKLVTIMKVRRISFNTKKNVSFSTNHLVSFLEKKKKN